MVAATVERGVVYVTRGLIEALLELAGEREPEAVSVSLSTTPAREFPGAEVPSGADVFTHFYLPSTGQSVRAVFGMDLATPPGTAGLFVSHPDGRRSVTKEDDLREVVFVAVPPWDETSVAAFGRDGSRYRLDIVDAVPPRESVLED
jgi:hypothetical protein